MKQTIHLDEPYMSCKRMSSVKERVRQMAPHRQVTRWSTGTCEPSGPNRTRRGRRRRSTRSSEFRRKRSLRFETEPVVCDVCHNEFEKFYMDS